MGKISEIFNFDNIGGKIKNLAKWSCWITILLIWVAAPIAFIVLVSDDWTAYLCWIPLVGAIVGPVLVWVESWVLYAFGEFVEDIHAIRDKEGTTKEVNAKGILFISDNNIYIPSSYNGNALSELKTDDYSFYFYDAENGAWIEKVYNSETDTFEEKITDAEGRKLYEAC